MQLTDDDIREFQEIWLRTFQEKISDADARTRGHELIELYRVLARPLPSEINETNKDSSSKDDDTSVQFRSSSFGKMIDILPPEKLPPETT